MLKTARLLTCLALLSGCTAQQVYSNNVYLLNTCGAPLDLTVANDSNYVDIPRSLRSNPDEHSSIAHYRSYGEDVACQIRDDYSLTLQGPDARRHIDGQALRKAVEGVARVGKKADRSWTMMTEHSVPESSRRRANANRRRVRDGQGDATAPRISRRRAPDAQSHTQERHAFHIAPRHPDLPTPACDRGSA